jgi:protein ImuB
MFVSVVALHIPRFALSIAAGGSRDLLAGPVALAPEPGRPALVGQPSPAAESGGVCGGMAVGEALARVPGLRLLPPDPVAVQGRWEELLRSLEGTGALVEDGGPGTACFEAGGLRRLHGGTAGVVEAARQAIGRPARFGIGPNRFCAVAAAGQARSRRPVTIEGAAGLAALPVALLAGRERTAHLPEELERLGVVTLGALAALPRDSVAERFGRDGLLAWELARGEDAPLRPRPPGESLEETLALPEAACGPQLQRALELLTGRLLARPERRGRPLRGAVLAAALEGGGSWRRPVTFREPLEDRERMVLALGRQLEELPAPAASLSLTARALGVAGSPDRELFVCAAARRAERLRSALGQVRAVAGPAGAMRVLMVDPGSRLPERRAVLAPYER